MAVLQIRTDLRTPLISLPSIYWVFLYISECISWYILDLSPDFGHFVKNGSYTHSKASVGGWAFVCMSSYIHGYIYIYTHGNIHLYTYTHICTCIHIFRARVFVCVCVCALWFRDYLELSVQINPMEAMSRSSWKRSGRANFKNK